MPKPKVHYTVHAHCVDWPGTFRTQCEAINYAERKFFDGTDYTVEIHGTVLASTTTGAKFPYCPCWRGEDCKVVKKVKKRRSFIRTVRLESRVDDRFDGEYFFDYKPGMCLYESIYVKAANCEFIGIITEIQTDAFAKRVLVRRVHEVKGA